MVVKIGKLHAERCGIGSHGSGIEVGEASFIDTGIAVLTEDAFEARSVHHPTAAAPLRKRAFRSAGKFLRDVSAGTIAAVLSSAINRS